MFYIAMAAVICGLAYMGWKLTSRSGYESAEYSVLLQDGDYELREYPDLMLASTEMESRSNGNDGSFGRLFRYISGGNENNQKVAMTTPVFMESSDSNGKMGFVIPKDVASSTIPEPSSNQVKLTKRLGGKFAVVRFAARGDLEAQSTQQTKLETWIEKQGLLGDGQAELAGYDPPWTPNIFRRNEILIRIRD